MAKTSLPQISYKQTKPIRHHSPHQKAPQNIDVKHLRELSNPQDMGPDILLDHMYVVQATQKHSNSKLARAT